jgi:hypothetical protein
VTCPRLDECERVQLRQALQDCLGRCVRIQDALTDGEAEFVVLTLDSLIFDLLAVLEAGER